MKELMMKECPHCHSLVRIWKECNCKDATFSCCGEAMKEVNANATDASFEKHVPIYEVKGNKIKVKVNHVMEENHYIEWIGIFAKNEEHIFYFHPNEVAEVEFPYIENATLYAYCNLHGLWKADIK